MCTIMAWETREGTRTLETKLLITDWEYICADLLATLAVTPPPGGHKHTGEH